MKNRFRIEIYDDIKANDLTIFADNNVDRELLSEYVFGNIRNFNTTVHAYVFDTLKKRNKSINVLNGFESLPTFTKEQPTLDFSRNSPYFSPESNSYQPMLHSKSLIRKPPTVWDKIQNKIL